MPIFGSHLQKFKCKNWLTILPLCDDMKNLVVGLLIWPMVMACHFPKVTKTGFCHQHSSMPIWPIFSSQVQKMSLLPSKFPTEKLAGYPSSLQWNAKLGGGIAGLAMTCHFPKVTKETVFCHQRPKSQFCRYLAGWLCKNCEFLYWKFQFKNWLAILPLCNGMQNLVLVLPVWLWCVIPPKWQKTTGLCNQSPKTPMLPIFGSQ